MPKEREEEEAAEEKVEDFTMARCDPGQMKPYQYHHLPEGTNPARSTLANHPAVSIERLGIGIDTAADERTASLCARGPCTYARSTLLTRERLVGRVRLAGWWVL